MEKKLLIILLMIICQVNLKAQWHECNKEVFDIVTDLVIKDNNIFTAYRNSGIFVSTDYGNSWVHISGDYYILSLAISDNKMYIGTQLFGVFLSTDGGNSWIQKDSGLIANNVTSIVLGDNYILAGTDNGLYRSTDNGDSWSKNSSSLSNAFVRSLTIKGNKIFAVTDKGLYLSTNNGYNWNILFYEDITSFTIDGNNMFMSTSVGIYLSTDEGHSWTRKFTLPMVIFSIYIYSLVVSGNIVFAGSNINGAYLSTDNGDNWIEVKSGLTDYQHNPICHLTIIDDYIFAGTTHGLFRAKLSEFNITHSKENNDDIEELNIYPNPACDYISIEYSKTSLSNNILNIYNSLGIKVKQFNYSELSKLNSIKYPIEDLPPGEYYCSIINEGRRIFLPFVVLK